MNRALIRDLFEMTKPRICMLALMMAALGYFLGSTGPIAPGKFILSLLGTALVGACCGALNMYIERDVDATFARLAMDMRGTRSHGRVLHSSERW